MRALNNRSIHSFIEPLEQRRLLAVDLSVTLDATGGTYFVGDLISGSFTLRNNGNSATNTSFKVQFRLSTDNVFGNGDDTTLTTQTFSGGIPANFSTKQNGSIPAPAVLNTDYYFMVKIDGANSIAESDETNNLAITDLRNIRILTNAGVIGVFGNNSANSIAVSTAGSNIKAVVDGDTRTYPMSKVTGIGVFGGAGNDSITIGDIEHVFVSGGDGNDYIVDGAGSNTLAGDAGKDKIYGGNGNDRLNGNGGNDQLYGQGGTDRLYGYLGNDYLDGGSSNDRLDGGGGIDILYAQGGNDRLYTNDGEVDHLYGGSGTDFAQTDVLDTKSGIEGVI